MDRAHGHAPRVHGDDLVAKAGEPALMLGDQDRLEAAIPVAEMSSRNAPSPVRTVLALLPLR